MKGFDSMKLLKRKKNEYDYMLATYACEKINKEERREFAYIVNRNKQNETTIILKPHTMSTNDFIKKLENDLGGIRIPYNKTIAFRDCQKDYEISTPYIRANSFLNIDPIFGEFVDTIKINSMCVDESDWQPKDKQIPDIKTKLSHSGFFTKTLTLEENNKPTHPKTKTPEDSQPKVHRIEIDCDTITYGTKKKSKTPYAMVDCIIDQTILDKNGKPVRTKENHEYDIQYGQVFYNEIQEILKTKAPYQNDTKVLLTDFIEEESETEILCTLQSLPQIMYNISLPNTKHNFTNLFLQIGKELSEQKRQIKPELTKDRPLPDISIIEEIEVDTPHG